MTRLNNRKRDLLLDHARSKMRKLEDDTTYKKMKKELESTLLAEEKKQLPAKDLKVLKKYNYTQKTKDMYIAFTDNDAVVEKHRYILSNPRETTSKGYYSDKPFVLPYGGTVYNMLTNFEQYETDFEKRIDEILRDYSSLIHECSTYKRVCEVWPEALEIASQIQGTALVKVTDEVKQRIAADVSSRK